MKICSFDPASIKNLGWSIVDYDNIITSVKCGTFHLPEVEQRWQVLGHISNNVFALFNSEHPDLVILEQTSSFAGNRFVTAQVSQCIGAILILCLQNNIKVEFVYPTHVKKILTGNGKATKMQIRKGIEKAIGNVVNKPDKYDSEHASDALGNVISWLIDREMIKNEVKL